MRGDEKEDVFRGQSNDASVQVKTWGREEYKLPPIHKKKIGISRRKGKGFPHLV